jgi:hypothetical protein
MYMDKKRFNTGGNKAVRMDAVVDMHKFTNAEFETFRFIGPARDEAIHWIKFRSKEGKVVSVPKTCLAYDHATGEFSKPCPYCKMLENTPRVEVYQNAISRKAQRNEPRQKAKPTKSESQEVKLWDGKSKGKLKTKSSDAWTPVKVVRLTSSVAAKISDLAALNIHRTKDGEKAAYGPEHRKHGFDLILKYDDAKKNPSDKYFIQKDKVRPLTQDEREYLLWKLDVTEVESYEKAEAEARKFLKTLVISKKTEDGKYIDVDANRSVESSGEVDDTGKKKKKDRKASQETEDDLDLEDLEEKPKKKKKKKKKKSKSFGF